MISRVKMWLIHRLGGYVMHEHTMVINHGMGGIALFPGDGTLKKEGVCKTCELPKSDHMTVFDSAYRHGAVVCPGSKLYLSTVSIDGSRKVCID